MIDILVVDDNIQIRETLRAILESRPEFHVVGEATDGIAASQLAQTLRPKVVLMDVGMVALVVGVIGYVVQKRRNTTREGGRPGTSPARR